MVADMTIISGKSTATLSHISHESSLVLYSESDRPANNVGALHVQSKGRLFIQMFSEKGQSHTAVVWKYSDESLQGGSQTWQNPFFFFFEFASGSL